MALIVNNTAYAGEVVDEILTTASTGNELVERGLIHIVEGVLKATALPRIRTGKMLQRRKSQPETGDSRSGFGYSEKELVPNDVMVFEEFSPKAFEAIWRPYQPTGNMVFQTLPPDVQAKLLNSLLAQTAEDIGDNMINGKYVKDGTNDQLINGIITQIAADDDVIIVDSSATTIKGRLAAMRAMIPAALRKKRNLRFLMSVNDFDKYDDELTEREYKNADETRQNNAAYKGIKIEALAAWPDDLIICTVCSMDADSNLYAAVSLTDDMDAVQVDKLTAAGEDYFFKMLMKIDTQIAFGEECIVLDSREDPQFTVPSNGSDSDSSSGSGNTSGSDDNTSGNTPSEQTN